MYILAESNLVPILVWGFFGAIILFFLISEIVGGIKYKDIQTSPDYLDRIIDLGESNQECFYFHPVPMRSDYVVENEKREVVYEAHKVYETFLKPQLILFKNYITNQETYHRIGKPSNTTYSYNVGRTSFGVRNFLGTYKFDKVNIWKYLQQNEIIVNNVEMKINGHVEYEVLYKGKIVATFSSTGTNQFGDQKNLFGKLDCHGYFKITTSKQYLDIAFLAAFSYARAEVVSRTNY